MYGTCAFNTFRPRSTELDFISLNLSETEFLLVGLPQQLSKLSNPMSYLSNNVTLLLVHYAPNSGVIFDSNLTFSQHISGVSKSCFRHIRDLIRRIRNTVDHTTACAIATSLIHSKLDYCSSLLLNLPSTQTKHLQLVLNATAGAVIRTPKFHHFSPILISFHWLKLMTEEFNATFFTYETLRSSHPSFLHSLSLKRICSTCSFSLVTKSSF
jgi:hypothetical protein